MYKFLFSSNIKLIYISYKKIKNCLFVAEMINMKLDQVRKKLDTLDLQLLNLIKKRTELVKKITKLKKFKKQIVDYKRIRKVLRNIRYQSIKKKIDPKITNSIWRSMIRSYIAFEKRNFNKK